MHSQKLERGANEFRFDVKIIATHMVRSMNNDFDNFNIQWNLSITDALGPDIFGYSLL